MKIVQITPSSGDGFYCENCLRDLTLVKTLRSRGHDVILVPLYLPLPIDLQGAMTEVPIFFGGVNVYLQQKLGLFRRTPRWLDKLFDHPGLLSMVSRRIGMTSARDLGETTLSMLKGQDGHQIKELDRLIEWLALDKEKPDVIILSNILLGGLAEALRERLRVPVVCMLQDEEAFVDGLGAPYAKTAWDLLQSCCQNIDILIAVSRSYRERIAARLKLETNRIHVIPMGIDIETYRMADAPPKVPTIGFLSRTSPERGLGVLVDAFILIKQSSEFDSCQLQISGGKSDADKPFLRDINRRLTNAGVAGDVSFVPEFSGEQRQHWLQGLTLMCVPEQEEAAYGLFAMEALTSGIPVVLPAIGVFPELMAVFW